MAISLSAPLSVLKEPNSIKEVLTAGLRDKYLTLFLGAGLSKSATEGFPSWIELVKNCCAKVGEKFDETKKYNNEYLRQQMDKVEARIGSEFVPMVKASLYSGIQYDYDLMKTDMLMAIGSMVMGSIRGTAASLVNYNYDDLLEWYLRFHGFVPQIISCCPEIERRADIHVYHPHGFLPKERVFEDYETSNIILTETSYLDSYKQVDAWNELQISIMTSRLCLFIGMSGNDPHIKFLARNAFNRVKEQGRSILGYMILVKNEEALETENLRSNCGIATVYVNDYKEIPYFLRKICKCAAELS